VQVPEGFFVYAILLKGVTGKAFGGTPAEENGGQVFSQ